MPKVPFTYKGIICPVLTPFNQDSTRTLNLSVVPQYADYLAKRKINGVLISGTTGEGPSMSVSERKLLAEAWANAVKTTKQHLMVQVGGAPLPDVLELAKHAESVKANSLLCLPELYFKPKTPEELKDYLKLVSSAAPTTPLLYYHFPGISGVDIHMGEFLESLNEEIPTLVGIKFTSSILDEGIRALCAKNNKYVVFLGNDELINAACAEGFDSFITASSNILPEVTLAVLAESKAGNIMKARSNQRDVSKLMRTIDKYGGWLNATKVTLTLISNINVGPPRAPWKPLSSQAIESLRKDLQDLGFKI